MTDRTVDADASTYSPSWLGLREPADAAARSVELAELVVDRLATDPSRVDAAAAGTPLPVVVHDLGCGSGSMGRWLAPRLPGPQHWVLHDRDPGLLGLAAANPGTPADGAGVTVEARCAELGSLSGDDFVGADLVTASALLDVLTRSEVEALVAAVAGSGCAALLTLTVLGRVRLDPADPADDAVAEAFNGHQRRPVGGRELLGPAAVEVASDTFARHGYTVALRPSPWQLGGPEDSALVGTWLDGWLDAATAQDPGVVAESYRTARSEQARAGRLTVTVAHADLLAVPAGDTAATV